MNKQNLYFCFPLSGPNNGVKVISTYIHDAFKKQDVFNLITIDTAQAKGFDNFGSLSLNKILQTFTLLSSLSKLKKGDVVYLNLTPKGFAFYRDLIMLCLCKLKNCNVTTHVHANGLEERCNVFTRFILKKVNIIAINQSQYTKIRNCHKRTFLVPNALPDYYNGSELVANLKTHKKTKLLFFSNLSKEKGLDRLVGLIKFLDDKEGDYEINICGGILTKEHQNIFVALKEQYPFINYYGPIKEDQSKFDFLSTNDFLLLLSDSGYEVSPLVYIEALMSGLPILTTAQEAANSIIESGCAFEVTEDYEELYKLTSKFGQSSQDLKDLKMKCRALYLKNYSFEKFIAHIVTIILK